MTIKANGRSTLILTAGLFVCLAGPSQAAASADNAATNLKSEDAAGAPTALNKYPKPGTRHSKSHAHHKSSKEAEKSSPEKSPTDKKPVATGLTDKGDNSAALPASVADAYAQLQPADTPTDSAKAMSARASEIVQNAPANPQPAAQTQLVSADQLNDVDRTLPASAPAAPTLAMASAEAPSAPAAPPTASSTESFTWEQTSLIGKIFIGFGALLTMASAARMFMA
jgi:hypothetical protein